MTPIRNLEGELFENPNQLEGELLFKGTLSNFSSDHYILDLKNGETTEICSSNCIAKYFRNGKSFLCSNNQSNLFERSREFDDTIIAEQVLDYLVSPSGNYIASFSGNPDKPTLDILKYKQKEFIKITKISNRPFVLLPSEFIGAIWTPDDNMFLSERMDKDLRIVYFDISKGDYTLLNKKYKGYDDSIEFLGADANQTYFLEVTGTTQEREIKSITKNGTITSYDNHNFSKEFNTMKYTDKLYLSPNHQRILFAKNTTSTKKIYAIQDGKQLSSKKDEELSEGEVFCWSPDSKLIAGLQENKVCIYTAKGELIRNYPLDQVFRQDYTSDNSIQWINK